MGSDLSRCVSGSPPPTAKVITMTGGLRQYPIPTTASHVLAQYSPSCFIADSDRLCYEEPIPALHAHEELRANQIYFILPTSELHNRLSAADMVALAVKATAAIKNRRCKPRISPLDPNPEMGSEMTNEKSIGYLRNRSAALMMLRSRSANSRFPKYTSRRGLRNKVPTRFQVGLSTIQEGTPL